MLQALKRHKFLYSFFTIAVVSLLCLTAGSKVKAQTKEEAKEQEILFVDTLEINKIQLQEELSTEEEEEEIDDSLQNAAIDDLDSLAQAEFKQYIPKTPMYLLEDRLACIEGEIPLTLNKRVAGFIDYFVVRNRNYTQTMLERKDVYFPLFEKYLKQFGLPDELKYLAIVESGLNHAAISRSAAVGLWQFMSFTGKDMKLYQDYYIDERMHPELSTIAACRYLKMLYNVFHDWELVLASYNCGLGKIMRVQRQTGKKKFWEMYDALPQETRAYVPQFVAVTYAMNYAAAHNLFPDADSMLLVPSNRDTVQINACLDLHKFSKITGAEHKIIKILNPELRRGLTPHHKPYTLSIPAELKPIVISKRQAILDSCTIPYDEAELAYRNPNLLKRKPNLAQAKLKAYNPSQEGLEKIYHRVQKGETIQSIANEYKVKISALKRWNKKRKNHLKAGEKLVVFREKEAQPPLASLQKAPSKSIANAAPLVESKAMPEPKADSCSNAILPVAAIKSPKKAKSATEEKANKETLIAASQKETEEQQHSSKKSSEKKEKTNTEKQIIYEVQPGDTLYKISRKFSGTSITQLMKLNDLKEGKITVGQKLIIG